MRECKVCRIPLDYRETCPSPGCPCVGTRAGSPEMAACAAAYRSRPSVAQARTLSGADALAALERRAWLDYAEAAGDVEFSHRNRPS